MIIRAATDADWPQIWPFFDEIVRAGETYTLPPDLTLESAKPWWMSDHVVVLEDKGVVLGSAKMGPNRPRRGEYVVQWHRDQGFTGIQFNAVVETNTVAVRLWQDLGFEIIGTVPGAFDSAAHGRVGLHVMYLALDDQD